MTFKQNPFKYDKAYLKGQQTDLDFFSIAWQEHIDQSTSFTPNMLMLGKKIRLPTEIV